MNVERWGWYSIGINIVLTLLNLAIAAASGSLAVAAEMVHNLVDLVASIAVLIGLKLSQRKSKSFPYGLYKVENVVAVAIALLIFFTGYEIAREALLAPPRVASVQPWMLAGVILSAVIPLVFSHFQMRVGREANSPALIADATEYRTHVFTTGVVLAALIGQRFDLPLDRIAALVIVIAIAKTGWEMLSDGMRVLLDASLDAETLLQIRHTIEAEPAVVEIVSVTGRNAGRYRFVEAEIALRTDDLSKAEAVTQRIEAQIRQTVPHVDRVLIHAEPVQRSHLRYAVPLDDPGGTLSKHLGDAPHWGFFTLRLSDGAVTEQNIAANPFLGEEKAKGIRVAEWLVAQKTDVVLLKENVQGKGPVYVFADAGVELELTPADTLAEAIALAKSRCQALE